MTATGIAILTFALAISPLVFFHEFGHYAIGRVFGVKAEVFSIGFGRTVTSWTDRRGTEWKLGWLPLGGYVKFAGDMNAASAPDAAWQDRADRDVTLHAKPVWQRALIVAAGPFANFLLAIVMLCGLFATVGEPRVSTEIGAFAPRSAAQAAGLRIGDRIVSVEGTEVRGFDDLATLIQVRSGLPTEIVAERAGRAASFVVTPLREEVRDLTGAKSRVGRIGIAPAAVDYVKPRLVELPAAATRFTVQSVRTMARTLGQIVLGQRSVDDLGGPVKVAAASGKIASFGVVSFLFFMVMLSINLGFINLLPIPMLDGGHLAFFAAEGLRGRPVSMAVQDYAYRGGLALLLAFTLFVTLNDLAGLGLFAKLAGLIG